MTKSLSIFEHKKGFFISNESLILIFSTIILFLIAYLHQTPNFDFGNLITFFSVIWFLYLTGFMISTFFLHQHKNGEFKGKLKLENDKIFINGKEYQIAEINNISIHSSDIKGQFIGYSFEFSRKLSNGLNNEINLKFKNGNEIKCDFLQTKRERIKYFKRELTGYHLRGKISWLNLLDTLDMDDYDDIQKFKKELK